MVVGVIVRARNERDGIKRLDISLNQQKLAQGVSLRKVLIDDNSTDGTDRLAARLGWEVVRLESGEFNYPHALNIGLEHLRTVGEQAEYVACISAHSWPVFNDYIQRAIHEFQNRSFVVGAVYGQTKAPTGSPWLERAKNVLFYAMRLIGAHSIKKVLPGLISNIGAIYSLEALRSIGDFDETMAGGGEDLRAGQQLFKGGWCLRIVPHCGVYHSHHLHIWQVRQMWAEHCYWKKVAHAALHSGSVPFHRSELWYRGQKSWLED
jgi:glycosyltransferase involved in cell wall biosynthesis